MEEKPKLLKDPVCFDGLWIDKRELDDPDFWNCGVRPLDIEHPICNSETGHWEKFAHDTAEDRATCGELPASKDFLVCDYV